MYNFLGNIPLISIQPQQVSIDVPTIDKSSFDKVLLNWQLVSSQWENEIKDWEARATVDQNVVSELKKLQSTLNKNIQILEDYKKIPSKIAKLLNQKEVRLGQILCNDDSISAMTGGRI